MEKRELDHTTAGLDPSRAAGLERIAAALQEPGGLNRTLQLTIERFQADTGTVHLLEDDGLLHLKAAGPGMPASVLAVIETIAVGKGMAGLAVERRQPVNACNLQEDASGDVRPGARATGLQGSIVVPMLRAGEVVGALGIANRAERTFTDEEVHLLLEVGRLLAESSILQRRGPTA